MHISLLCEMKNLMIKVSDYFAPKYNYRAAKRKLSNYVERK